jgi:hypothetical protein
MDHDDFLPEPPIFDAALIEQCRQERYSMPLVFEWYKYVGILATYAASLLPDAPGARDIPPQTYTILSSLLMRCSRLMRAGLELASKHRFGEALQILSRSICESAIKSMWLTTADEDQIRSFIADGLAAELELHDLVERNVSRRGYVQVIEKRMLESVERAIKASGIERDKIRKTARQLPNVRQMYNAIDPNHGDGLYVVVQKIGSHATHGTWLDLLFHYTDESTGNVALNYDHVAPDEDGMRMSALLVNEAVAKFFAVVSPPEELNAYVSPKIQAAEQGLLETLRLSYGNDFDAVR